MGEGQGPHPHEQDLVRTIRDTGERERGAHRDTEGGWAGFTHTTGSRGFLSRIGQVAPGGTGAGALQAGRVGFCLFIPKEGYTGGEPSFLDRKD